MVEANERLSSDTLELNDKLVKANSALEEKIRQLEQQASDLESTNQALEENFDHSLDMLSIDRSISSDSRRANQSGCFDMQGNRQVGIAQRTGERSSKGEFLAINLGRIGLPRELLTKSLSDPQSLDEQERILLHHYPVYGQTLAGFVGALEEVGLAIRAHREASMDAGTRMATAGK